jgi:hypothetical protein
MPREGGIALAVPIPDHGGGWRSHLLDGLTTAAFYRI